MGTFYGFWSCDYCGRENSGKDRSCKGCGHPRDKNTKFYPTSRGDKNKPREYINGYVKKGPDWNCSYCGSMNPADNTNCESCGHPRDKFDKHYFELHPERKTIRKNLSDFDENDEAPNFDESDSPTEQESPKHNDAFAEPIHEDSKVKTAPSKLKLFNKLVNNFIENYLPYIVLALGGIALIVALVAGLVYLLKPTIATITIVDKTWQRQVVVEEYRTFHEEDWSIPIGGRKTGSHAEIHHYDNVIDHYETVTRTRTVQSGGHYEVTGYQDNGDGTFTEVESYVPEYTTETYTEQEPVYVSIPVYATKYEYDIERWTFDHYETTSGHTDKPYFADVDLPKNFRTNGTTETYKITANYEKEGKLVTKDFIIDYEKWQQVSIGDEYTVKIYVENILEFIEE